MPEVNMNHKWEKDIRKISYQTLRDGFNCTYSLIFWNRRHKLVIINVNVFKKVLTSTNLVLKQRRARGF